MNERDHLEEYFQLCKRIYEQMERDGTWPWKTDSTKITIDIEPDDVRKVRAILFKQGKDCMA